MLFSLAGMFVQEKEQPCACCSAQHQQFNFWIGEWDVYNRAGEKIGENTITALENHCIINENWKGLSGGSGRSYNYFDPETGSWNQLWLSATGTILKLSGVGSDRQMILKSGKISGENGDYYNQITWTRNTDGNVTQLWEILDTKDQLLSKAFEGIYRRKTN